MSSDAPTRPAANRAASRSESSGWKRSSSAASTAASPARKHGGLQHHDDFASPAPSWAKVQVVDTFGYTRVTVVNATHMKVQAINYVNDSAFDEFWLEAP